MRNYLRKPEWITKLTKERSDAFSKIGTLLVKYNLNTVCDAARCPNRRECYNSGTATFMLLGNICTRNCTFCNVQEGKAQKVDTNEPQNVANAVKELNIRHAVITSVTRDDLKDGGASHFAETIKKIKELNCGVTVEVLIPDFQGGIDALKTVINASPDVINHNVETVPELYEKVRPMAIFERSLQLLERVKKLSSIPTKTGFMLGLGESEKSVYRLIDTLRNIDCDILTIGQYLQPSKAHYPLVEYIHPHVFDKLGDYARSIGFKYVVSSPLTRSSYKAKEELKHI